MKVLYREWEKLLKYIPTLGRKFLSFSQRMWDAESVSIQLSLDGVQLWKSYREEFWSVMARIIGEHPALIALYFGKGKLSLTFMQSLQSWRFSYRNSSWSMNGLTQWNWNASSVMSQQKCIWSKLKVTILWPLVVYVRYVAYMTVVQWHFLRWIEIPVQPPFVLKMMKNITM